MFLPAGYYNGKTGQTGHSAVRFTVPGRCVTGTGCASARASEFPKSSMYQEYRLEVTPNASAKSSAERRWFTNSCAH